jgi:hypothetical protein
MPIFDDDLGTVTVGRRELEQLRVDQVRARFLTRAWARMTGLTLAAALVEIDKYARGAKELGEAELDKMVGRKPDEKKRLGAYKH